jgi:hypothetical protein
MKIKTLDNSAQFFQSGLWIHFKNEIWIKIWDLRKQLYLGQISMTFSNVSQKMCLEAIYDCKSADYNHLTTHLKYIFY